MLTKIQLIIGGASGLAVATGVAVFVFANKPSSDKKSSQTPLTSQAENNQQSNPESQQSTPATITSSPPSTPAASSTTPSPTPTPTAATRTPTPSLTATPTVTPTPTPVVTPTPQTPTPTPTPSSGGSTPPTPPTTPTYVFKNATYNKQITYFPNHGSVTTTVNFTLTVNNDNVSAINCIQITNDSESNGWINIFLDAKASLVGQKLNTVSASRVGGASYTSTAFNDAINYIKNLPSAKN